MIFLQAGIPFIKTESLHSRSLRECMYMKKVSRLIAGEGIVLSARFLYIMRVAYLLISDLNIKQVLIKHPSKSVARLLSWPDLSESIIPKWKKGEKTQSITTEDTICTGRKALFKLILRKQYLGFFYFTFLIVYMMYSKILNGLILPVLRHLF